MSESLPERVNHVEKVVHTHDHRISVLEGERLPFRVATLESLTKSIHEDVEAIHITTQNIERSVVSQQAQMKTFAWVLSAVAVLIQIGVAVWGVVTK